MVGFKLNYSDEIKDSLNVMSLNNESSTFDGNKIFECTNGSIADIKRLLDDVKLNVFWSILDKMISASIVIGGSITVIINEEESIGQMLYENDSICILSKKNDFVREALRYIVDKSDSVIFHPCNEKLCLDIMVKAS